MADDAFHILGQILVDLGALKASLGAAEAAVRASTERQAKSYTDFANIAVEQQRRIAEATQTAQKGEGGDLYKMKYGQGGAGGGAGGLGAGAAKHAKEAADAFEKLHKHAGLSIHNIRGISAALNIVAPGLGGMAIGILHVVRFLGIWGGLLGAIGLSIKYFGDQTARAAEQQQLLNRALAKGDLAGIEGELKKASDAYTDQLDILKRSQQEWTSYGSVIDAVKNKLKLYYNELTGKGLTATGKNLEDLKKSVAVVAKDTEGKEHALAVAKALNAAETEAAKQKVTLADTVASVTGAYTVLNQKIKDAHDLHVQEITDAADKKKKELGGALSEDDERVKQIRVNMRANIGIAEKELTNTLNGEAQKQRAALVNIEKAETTHTIVLGGEVEKRKQAEIGQTIFLIGEYEKRKQTILAFQLFQIKSAETLAQAQATARGLVFSGTAAIENTYAIQKKASQSAEDAIESRFKKEKEATESAETDAEAQYKIKKASLDKLIATEENWADHKRELDQATAERETARADAKIKLDNADTARATEHIDFLSTQEQAAEQKRQDLLIETERVRKAITEKNVRDTEAYFGVVQAGLELQKSMGLDVSQGELAVLDQRIAKQKELNAQAMGSLQEQLAGQRELLSLQQQRIKAEKAGRDAARSEASQLIAAAAESFKKRTGRTTATQSELQDELGRIQEKNKGVIGGFQGGSKTNLDDLQKSFGQLGLLENFNTPGGGGGSLSNVMGKALAPSNENMFTKFGEGSETFSMAVAVFRDAAERLAARRETEVTPSEEYLKDPSKNKLSEEIGRQTYLESKRAPAENITEF